MSVDEDEARFNILLKSYSLLLSGIVDIPARVKTSRVISLPCMLLITPLATLVSSFLNIISTLSSFDKLDLSISFVNNIGVLKFAWNFLILNLEDVL